MDKASEKHWKTIPKVFGNDVYETSIFVAYENDNFEVPNIENSNWESIENDMETSLQIKRSNTSNRGRRQRA